MKRYDERMSEKCKHHESLARLRRNSKAPPFRTIHLNLLEEAWTQPNTIVIGGPPTTSVLSATESLTLNKLRGNVRKNTTINATAGPSKLRELGHKRPFIVRSESLGTIVPDYASDPQIPSVGSTASSNKGKGRQRGLLVKGEEELSETESWADLPRDSLELIRGSIPASSRVELNDIRKGKQPEVPYRLPLGRQAMDDFRKCHDCSHPNWRYRAGTGHCDYCSNKLRSSRFYVSKVWVYITTTTSRLSVTSRVASNAM